MITVEYPPGWSDPVHRHNAQGFIYVLEGSVCDAGEGRKTNDADTRTNIFMKAPTMFISFGRNASTTKAGQIPGLPRKEQGHSGVGGRSNDRRAAGPPSFRNARRHAQGEQGMKIVVIGGSGLIGSKVVTMLTQQGPSGSAGVTQVGRQHAYRRGTGEGSRGRRDCSRRVEFPFIRKGGRDGILHRLNSQHPYLLRPPPA